MIKRMGMSLIFVVGKIDTTDQSVMNARQFLLDPTRDGNLR